MRSVSLEEMDEFSRTSATNKNRANVSSSIDARMFQHQDRPPPFYCEICDTKTSQRDKIPHLRGKRHKKNMQMKQTSISYGKSLPQRHHLGAFRNNPYARKDPDQSVYSRYSSRSSGNYGIDSINQRFRPYLPERGPVLEAERLWKYESRLNDIAMEEKKTQMLRRKLSLEKARMEELMRTTMPAPRSSIPRLPFPNQTTSPRHPFPNQTTSPSTPATERLVKWFCDICHSWMQQHDKPHHLRGRRHRTAEERKRNGTHEATSVPKTDTEDESCKYFARGFCMRNESCSFKHIPDNKDSGSKHIPDIKESASELCKFFARGYCGRGQTCLFKHPVTKGIVVAEEVSESGTQQSYKGETEKTDEDLVREILGTGSPVKEQNETKNENDSVGEMLWIGSPTHEHNETNDGKDLVGEIQRIGSPVHEQIETKENDELDSILEELDDFRDQLDDDTEYV